MFLSVIRKFKFLLKNPMVVFVYSIISKWAVVIIVAIMVVTFWVFKGLSDAGILNEVEKVVSRALNDTKSVAKYCVPKIASIRNFWNCLQDPPDYKPDEDEEKFEEGLNDLLNYDRYDHTKDPYAK